jgi:predicted Zn-dependent peptidase
MHARATLPNGIRLLTSRMPYVRSVSLIYFFGVGSRYETAATSGVSHLIEHMLFKGSERYPTAQVISETIEGLGGVLDAATDKELTVYSAKVASRHFDLAMGLIADMVRHPRLDPAELEKERRVIVEELSMYRDSPQDWVSVLGDETFWPDLPLGREVAGTKETVESITRDAMDAFRRSHYVPGNLVLSVVGNIEHEQALETATRLLGDWEPRDVPLWTPCPPPPDTARVNLEQRRTEQTNLCLYTMGISHTHPDYYTMVLLNAILGDGMASRLFIEVREQQGLAYDVSSAPVHYYDTGAFVVYAGVEPTRAEAALQAILNELGRMRGEPVSERELTRAKEYTKGRMALRLEDTHSVASWLGGQEALLGEVRELDEILARIDAVTAEDIQRLAATLFQDEWLRLALIGPHKDAQAFERILHL